MDPLVFIPSSVGCVAPKSRVLRKRPPSSPLGSIAYPSERSTYRATQKQHSPPENLPRGQDLPIRPFSSPQVSAAERRNRGSQAFQKHFIHRINHLPGIPLFLPLDTHSILVAQEDLMLTVRIYLITRLFFIDGTFNQKPNKTAYSPVPNWFFSGQIRVKRLSRTRISSRIGSAGACWRQ